jgi:8-oxo-dGTP pyrophosphatase MutT (NUDIX family)
MQLPLTVFWDHERTNLSLNFEVLALVRVEQGYTTLRPILRRINPKDNGQMNKRWKPSVTVAAIIERDGRYMLIEEHTPEGLRLNNPAGHLDPGESPEDGCAREALEETTHTFKPTELVGIYISRLQRPAREGRAAEDVTYFRLAFCGELGEQVPGAKLDKGIVRTLWMTPDEIRANVDRLRSPLVLRCMEDHLAGQRFPLAMIYTDPSVLAPAKG